MRYQNENSNRNNKDNNSVNNIKGCGIMNKDLISKHIESLHESTIDLQNRIISLEVKNDSDELHEKMNKALRDHGILLTKDKDDFESLVNRSTVESIKDRIIKYKNKNYCSFAMCQEHCDLDVFTACKELSNMVESFDEELIIDDFNDYSHSIFTIHYKEEEKKEPMKITREFNVLLHQNWFEGLTYNKGRCYFNGDLIEIID